MPQSIFTDDLVIKDGVIGLVERAPNSSDEESADEDDIVDDEAQGGRLRPGSASVHWQKQDTLRTEYTANLRLADRMFLLGDIVTRVANQIGQTGVVIGMRMFCDVRCSSGRELKAVPSTLLQEVPKNHQCIQNPRWQNHPLIADLMF